MVWCDWVLLLLRGVGREVVSELEKIGLLGRDIHAGEEREHFHRHVPSTPAVGNLLRVDVIPAMADTGRVCPLLERVTRHRDEVSMTFLDQAIQYCGWGGDLRHGSLHQRFLSLERTGH